MEYKRWSSLLSMCLCSPVKTTTRNQSVVVMCVFFSRTLFLFTVVSVFVDFCVFPFFSLVFSASPGVLYSSARISRVVSSSFHLVVFLLTLASFLLDIFCGHHFLHSLGSAKTFITFVCISVCIVICTEYTEQEHRTKCEVSRNSSTIVCGFLRTGKLYIYIFAKMAKAVRGTLETTTFQCCCVFFSSPN